MADLMHFHRKKAVSFRKLLSFFFVIALLSTAAIQKQKQKTFQDNVKVNEGQCFFVSRKPHHDVYFSILHPTRLERWDFICSRRMFSQCSKPILFTVKKSSTSGGFLLPSHSQLSIFAWSATAVSAEEAMHRSNKGKKIRLATTNVKTRFHVHNRLGNLSFSSFFSAITQSSIDTKNFFLSSTGPHF